MPKRIRKGIVTLIYGVKEKLYNVNEKNNTLVRSNSTKNSSCYLQNVKERQR